MAPIPRKPALRKEHVIRPRRNHLPRIPSHLAAVVGSLVADAVSPIPRDRAEMDRYFHLSRRPQHAT